MSHPPFDIPHGVGFLTKEEVFGYGVPGGQSEGLKGPWSSDRVECRRPTLSKGLWCRDTKTLEGVGFEVRQTGYRRLFIYLVRVRPIFLIKGTLL